MKDQERSARPLEMGTTRVEAFSDGVMAIAITLLVPTRPPEPDAAPER